MSCKLPDEPLSDYIRKLHKSGDAHRFYLTTKWRKLRKQVLSDEHNECAHCKLKSPAMYSKATTVHHVNHIDKRPDLALTRWIEHNGERVSNLEPLCHECHDIEHGRFYGTPSKVQLNKERW